MAEQTSGYMEFVAEQNVPDERGMSVEVGDHILVEKPVHDRHAWLHGVNLRTRVYGEFNARYCQVTNENATPQRPPKSMKPSNVRRSKTLTLHGHPVEKVCVQRVTWCANCHEHIWGGARVSYMCTNCFLCSHSGCYHIFEEEPCQPQGAHFSRESITKHVQTWSTNEIVEWLAALRFYPYLHAVHSSGITGLDLASLTDESLKRMGIENDLHRQFVRLALDELLLPPPTEEELASNVPLEINMDTIATHQRLYEHTFTTPQHCDMCTKPMFGMLKQGYMCLDCGVQCHKCCAYQKIDPCTRQYTRARRSSDSEDPQFCCNFNNVVIPPVMQRCLEAVETHPRYSFNVYASEPPHQTVTMLRAALNQDPQTVEMHDSEWSEPGCAASVLKSFLAELPDPLIVVECYDEFIKTARLDYNYETIATLLKQLPDCNYSHLNFILQHLVWLEGVTANNIASIESLSQIFSLLLIRPAERDVRKLVQNLSAHTKVVEMLLRWTQEKLSDPIKALGVNDEVWFWGDTTKSEVSEALRSMENLQDGHFLVRNSENRVGDWALTVIKDGRERLIRLMQKNGRFGFQQSLLLFSSLSSLVNYYRYHSLKDNTSSLDVKLLCPVAKEEKIQLLDPSLVQEKYKEIDEKLKKIKFLEYDTETKHKELEECKTLSETQTDIVRFVTDQKVIAQQNLEQCTQAIDREVLEESLQYLQCVLKEESDVWTELDLKLEELSGEWDYLNTQLTEKRTELPILQKEHAQLESQMLEINPKVKEDLESQKLEDIYDVLPASAHVSSVPRKSNEDLNQSLWFFDQHLERSTIEQMLKNKPSGTFLVRLSKTFPYSISLVHDSNIKHIPIYKGEQGYGFAEPHNIHPTLQSLINHYHLQTLRMHNNSLDTTLKIPYRFFEDAV